MYMMASIVNISYQMSSIHRGIKEYTR